MVRYLWVIKNKFGHQALLLDTVLEQNGPIG